MDDREKEIEKKIREFDRLQLLTELRFKRLKEMNESTRKAEERALEAYPEDIQLFVESQETPGKWLPVDNNLELRVGFERGYEQAERETIAEVERWLKANFHHRNCWNADEFCVSLRTHFGIEK